MGKREIVASAILLSVIGLVAAASYMPLRSLWGVNVLQFLSPPLRAAFWALMACAAALFVLPAKVSFPAIGSGLDRLLFGSSIWPRALFSALCAALFYLLRAKTHFLGDGYTLLSVFGHGPQIVLKWTEPGAIMIIHYIQTLLGGYTRDTALLAFRLLSYISGAVCIFNFLYIARTLSTQFSLRLVIFATLALSGVAVMFFGYVEYYPMIWALLTTFVVLALRHTEKSGSLLVPILVLLLACAIHLQALILAPAAAYLFWLQLKRAGVRPGVLGLLLAATVALAVALFALLIWAAGKWLGITTIFLPWLSGRPATPDYAVVSWAHLRDIANLVLLVYPGLIALIGAFLVSKRLKADDPFARFLAWGSLGSLLFLLLIDPGLGMPRDWDLMSITLLFPCLYLLRKLSLLEWKPSSRFASGYTLTCFALTLVFLASILDSSAAEARALDLLRNNKLKDNAGWSILSNYYQEKGDLSKAQEITTEMFKVFPDDAELSQAHLCLNRGEYARALTLSEELYHKNPYRSDYLQVYGTALWKSGHLPEAIDLYKSAIELRPYFPHLKNDLGQIYIQLGRLDDAFTILKEARAQDPTLTFVAESIALAYLKRKNYDSAMAIADTLMKKTDDAAGSHLIQLVVAINTGNIAYAKDEYAKYLATGQTRSDYQRIKEYYAWVARDTIH